MESLLNFFTESFDLPILDWITENLHCSFLDFLMPRLTALGNGGIFWIALAVILLCIPKCRKAGLAMGIALLVGLLVCNITLKPLIGRIRPYTYVLEHTGRNIPLLISTPKDYAFPSGHTAASFEAAVALLLNHKKLGVPAMVLAWLIAFSRLYLYVHYPTDVIFSILLGTALAYLGNFLARKCLQNK